MKKLVVILVALLCVLIAGDFAASAAAEQQVAKKMRSQLHLSEDPEVQINGFPFLGQAVQGDYRNIELASHGVPVGDLKRVGIEASLRHVRLPLSDVMNGRMNNIAIDHVTGRVRLTEKDVGQAIHIPDLQIAPAPRKPAAASSTHGGGAGSARGYETEAGPTNQTRAPVQLTGTVNVAGVPNKVTVIGALELANGKIKVTPRKLEAQNSVIGRINLPDYLERPVLEHFNTTLDPGMLPLTVTPTAIRAEKGSLVVEGDAKNVSFGKDGVHSK